MFLTPACKILRANRVMNIKILYVLIDGCALMNCLDFVATEIIAILTTMTLLVPVFTDKVPIYVVHCQLQWIGLH